MKKYEVGVKGSYTKYFYIEAENEKEAAKEVADLADDDPSIFTDIDEDLVNIVVECLVVPEMWEVKEISDKDWDEIQEEGE